MVSKSKAKGSYHERWFLKLWNSLGIKTKKQPLSGSLGGEYKGDLTIEIDGKILFVEVKYRDKSSFPNVFNILEDRDIAVCKRKTGDPRYCVVISDRVWESTFTKKLEDSMKILNTLKKLHNSQQCTVKIFLWCYEW